MLLGIVLAGGRSSRMGEDKALLTLHGQTQLQRCCDQLQAVGCDKVVVSRNHPGFTCDAYENCGPLGGVHACLKQHTKKHAINEACILPIDMPLLESNVLVDLCMFGYQNKQHCYYESMVLPLYLYQPDQQITVLADRLEKKQYAIQSWLQVIHASALPKPMSKHHLSFINTNTPAHWQQVEQFILSKMHKELR